ncbi:MAG: hypothetical protein KGY75_08790 [Candidatus Cloacimonetes bacterium]|nr:hypothetical protein [Candidatus Cloacimonadota bacterium]
MIKQILEKQEIVLKSDTRPIINSTPWSATGGIKACEPTNDGENEI